jgi:hypothetical protein
MNVVVAPVSNKMLVSYSLTGVVKYIKEDLDGFNIFFAETTPSTDVSDLRNLDRPKSHVQIVHIECMKMLMYPVMFLYFVKDLVNQ